MTKLGTLRMRRCFQVSVIENGEFHLKLTRFGASLCFCLDSNRFPSPTRSYLKCRAPEAAIVMILMSFILELEFDPRDVLSRITR